ncbi:FadR/GntR family transcriptional regulator [uncultured Desulfobacter sp.]|uniref:FadR/GntR family transcriptional regulator n=1 Tax=uncultured Desulfobacter sp. TaxID=240139 RepID=UPI0029F55B5A|nr:FadR/GntR family transcriptional regulator [uncultured Desulfobacter sp.]
MRKKTTTAPQTENKMASIFKKAKQSRVFQDVVEQIEDAILNGRLEPGTRLPAERELKEMFNTSRGTLREALRVLEQKGLIRIKLGVAGGAYVKQIDAEPVMQSLALLIRSGKVSPDHLAEFRIKIEGAIVELAAQRATPGDIETMEDLYEQARQHYENGDWESFLKTDEAMHAYIGTMSGNPVFQLLQQSIHTNIHEYYGYYLPMNKESTLENLNDFKKIIAALKSGNGRDAADLIMDHVARFNKKMTRKVDSHPLP